MTRLGILVYEFMDKEDERRLYRDGVASSMLLVHLVGSRRQGMEGDCLLPSERHLTFLSQSSVPGPVVTLP